MDEDDSLDEGVQDDGEIEEKEDCDSSRFIFTSSDWNIIQGAKLLLWKIVRSSAVKPSHLVGLGKALYVLERLPQVTKGVSVVLELSSPTQQIDEQEVYRFYQVTISGSEIEISSGGHLYSAQVGGDTFTCFSWLAQAGCDTSYQSYLDQLWVLPTSVSDFASEVKEMDLSQDGYKWDVTDESDEIEMSDSGEK